MFGMVSTVMVAARNISTWSSSFVKAWTSWRPSAGQRLAGRAWQSPEGGVTSQRERENIYIYIFDL